MRTLTSIFSIVALTFTLGCSSGSGDDGGGPAVDAAPAADAAPTIDAMPANPPIASGVGEICDPSAPTCTSAGTPGCAAAPDATSGFCTLECATDIAMGEIPDAAASQACVAEYTGSTATALCALPIGPGAGNMTTNYACGLYCGMIGDPAQDLGTCPGGLTCTNNACSP